MSQIVTKRYRDALKSVERDGSLLTNEAKNDRFNEVKFEEGNPLSARNSPSGYGEVKNRMEVRCKSYHTVPRLPWLERKQ